MDQPLPGGTTLFSQLNSEQDISIANFTAYYDQLNHTTNASRGSLPLRIWQFYAVMVQSLRAGKVQPFVCAAGILSHYVGDASQPLHGSYLADGDPNRQQQRSVRRRSGEVEVVTEMFGKGVHSAYETAMLNRYTDDLMALIDSGLPASHGLNAVTGGRQAAFAVVALMKRVRQAVDPMRIVEIHANAVQSGESSTNELWTELGDATAQIVIDGGKVLSMLWDSAWREGGGDALPDNALRAVPEARLMTLYADQEFVPSIPVDHMGEVLG